MELNVCSRRVHDGYATIRARGRSRPRAVYRSDSEELLKETNGPYAPMEMSSIVSLQGSARVPRWCDAGKDSFAENYGTLKASLRRAPSLNEGRKSTPDDQVPILNTFASKTRPRRQSSCTISSESGTTFIGSESEAPQTPVATSVLQNGDDARRVYDSLPLEGDRHATINSDWVQKDNHADEERSAIRSPEVVQRDIGWTKFAIDGNVNSNENNCTVDNYASLRSSGHGGDDGFLHADNKNNKRTPANKTRQPIYAIPNVPRLNNKPPRAPRDPGVEGNYVPSGDLYRSTAQYIEDLNRNIAKIDKNYAEMKSGNNRNSTYGIINKIAKNDVENSSKNIYGVHRKRDMVPMPPISPNFGEPSEDREFEFKAPNGTAKKTTKARPNSYGKLPPKVLPRSSSIESTSSPSRNSNGSSSSAKSTESLYAISEALAGLPKSRVTFQEPNVSKNTFSSNEVTTNVAHTLPVKRSSFRNRKDRARPLDNSKEDILSVTLNNATGRSVTLCRRNTERILRRNPSEEEMVDDVFVENANNSFRSSPSRKVSPKSAKVVRTITRRNSARSHEDILSDTLAVGTTYGTLPYRKPGMSPRPLHKSSEDVLDGARNCGIETENLGRAYKSTVDVRDHTELLKIHRRHGSGKWMNAVPVCLLDATDVILNGQLQRSKELLNSEKRPEEVSNTTMDTVDHYAMLQAQFRGEGEDHPNPVDDKSARKSSRARTRHNSLELDADASVSSNNMNYATLPRRRGNAAKADQDFADCPKRLSGTLPVLEPLYEHAVSDPVKPRNPDNVIPWWELATRKYRHRSCPSLQAHVVSAFEQSLSNMTQRLQYLTATAEKKDSELQELRDTIERLRKQSAEAGLNASNQNAATNGRRHTLGDSESTTGCTGSNSNHQGSSMARQLSADSVTSLNSLSSACSASSHHKKKGWLRSSFSKAFSRSRKNRHGSVSDAEDCKDGPGEMSAPNSPRLPTAAKHESRSQTQGPRSNGQRSPENENGMTGSKSSSALYKKEDEDVDELKKQLREKDMVLTDIRLEALSSAHQLESLKDTVIKMRNEMLNLKQNNERLQRLVTSKSLTSSQSSLPSDPERRFSMTEVASSVAAMSSGGNHPQGTDQLEDLSVSEHSVVQTATTMTNEPPIEQDTDGKRINVAVYLGSERSFNLNVIGNTSTDGKNEPAHCVIASVCISNKTTWDSLDATVRRCFKEYVARVDPVTNLGLGVECIAAYHLGESSRCTADSQLPELLPCGYLVGHVRTIYLVLSGYSWLAVDTLIPRSIVQRLVSLLTEHRRVILCGPSDTGKSYLAGKLAHALVDTDTETKYAASVATVNVDDKPSKELRQYLAHIAERCDSSAADELPRVIILENLQHAASLGELFSGLLGTRHSSCPAIIGTMSQATCSTTNLQLHHNFRWVLCANHMEPVKGFLGRYLRRRLLEHELRESGGTRNAKMAAVVEWIPRVWLHVNKFLETHSSSDVTIGPRLFLSCPMEVAGSQVWFTGVWNYSVLPYLVDAVREGLTLYGRRISGNGNGDSPWEDPTHFITSSYPWVAPHAVHGGSDALHRMRPEDVGYDVSSAHNSGVGASSVKSLGSTHSDTEGDPLLNMLMRLQEAANYSSPHSNDSDSVTSLDSSHTRHSEDLTCSSSTSSSRGVESTL